MDNVTLKCYKCGREYSGSEIIWKCDCGGILDVWMDYKFRKSTIKRSKNNLWRYRRSIPVSSDENIVSFSEGFTPMIGIEIGGKEILFKQDYLFPTGSFKDRGSTVLVSKIKELGIDRVVEDSSGNAGSSIAAYSSRAGINCEIYVPDYTPGEKLTQIISSGAELKRIEGTREDTQNAAVKRAEDIYYASHHWNPFFLQATRTYAFEAAEQLGWKSPDAVVLPVGSGSLILGAYRGFREMHESGVIRKVPELIGVQAENCAPLVKAFRGGLDYVPSIIPEDTIAEGIAISNPARGEQILDSIIETGGIFISVTEEEIRESLEWIVRRGFYIEVTSAATIAGVKKFLREYDAGGTIVSTLTSHGLKNSSKIRDLLS